MLLKVSDEPFDSKKSHGKSRDEAHTSRKILESEWINASRDLYESKSVATKIVGMERMKEK